MVLLKVKLNGVLKSVREEDEARVCLILILLPIDLKQAKGRVDWEMAQSSLCFRICCRCSISNFW